MGMFDNGFKRFFVFVFVFGLKKYFEVECFLVGFTFETQYVFELFVNGFEKKCK